MQTRKKVHFSSLLVTLVLVLASPARGDESTTEQAKQHYENGSKQYDLGHWDEAIREYETAYELRPDPSFLYNLAQAYRRKGDAKRALDLYRNYLVKTPKSPLRAEIEERIKSLQKQIDEANSAKPALPALEPPASPLVPPSAPAEGAAPAVAPATSSPPASPLVPPSAPAEGAAPAVAPATSSPPASPGLAPEALPATTPVSPPADQAGQAAPVTNATPSRPTVTEAVPPAKQGRGLLIATIVSGAVGVVAIGAGVTFGVLATSMSRKVTDASRFNPSDDSTGKAAQTAQWYCYIGGAVFIAAGATLGTYYGVRAARTTPSSLSLSPVLGPGTAGVSAMGVF
jgi:Tetratricopeptide repeat